MKDSRGTQRGRILELLKSRAGQWVPLPDVLALGCAQFGARILELRLTGYTILNRTEHLDGKVWSWYKLEPKGNAKEEGLIEPAANLQPQPATFPEFGSLAKESYGVD